MSDAWSHVVKRVLFPLQCRWEHNTVPRHLRRLEASQWWSPERIADLQLEKVKVLLDRAYADVPLYRQRLEAAGFRPGDLTSLDQLAALPLLTKADIRERHDDLLSRRYDPATLASDKTGGSTGRPLHFKRTWDRSHSRTAAALRHDRWTGWDIGMKTAGIWGHRGDLAAPRSRLNRLRVAWLDRLLVLDSSSLTPERMEAFRRRLLDYRPYLYVAYANSMYLFARYLEERAHGDYHRPGAIVTSAEYLEPDRRRTIERVFGCPVFNRYGSRETSIIASECGAHEGLHLCAETLVVEFLREGRPARPGENGRIVVTDLENHAMPFIRYEIGDVGAPMAPVPCACGRGLPRMEVAAGRVTDFLVSPTGTIVSGAALTIYLIANAPGVAQAQLVQEVKERVLIRVVPGSGYGDATIAFFREQLPRFFGGEIAFDVETVDDIPCEPSGKYRFSISRLDPAEFF